MAATVDSYINLLNSPNREIAKELRRIIREAAPEAKESIKWGMPVYEQNGNFCGIDGKQKRVNFQFFKGALLSDPEGLLEGTGKGMRHIKVRDVKNVREDYVKKLVREAVHLNNRQD